KHLNPVPWLELHGHGGREVVRFLLELFTARGLRPCTWQDFVRLTHDDTLRAEAVVALAEARTTRTASILLDQYQGALGEAVAAVVAALDRGDETGARSQLAELAAVVAALDRGDETGARSQLAELAGRTSLGRHLTKPWRVAVAGAPNVGKSSLV